MQYIGLAAAYRLTAPPLTGVLMERLREETIELLRRGYGVPRWLTDEVIASGDRELLMALASNYGYGVHMRAAHVRLARLGDPEFGRVLYKTGRPEDGSDVVRAAVLAGADQDDPRWRSEGGLVDEVLGACCCWPHLLEPALEAPFLPELVAGALIHHGTKLPPSTVRAVCRAFYACGGREELTTLADIMAKLDEVGHRGLAALLRRAAADSDPPAVLSGEPSPTDKVMYEARSHGHWRLDTTVTVDWDAVRAEHRRLPFSPDAIMTLNRFPGCPQDLAVEGFRADPTGTMARGRGPLPPSVLIEPDLDFDSPFRLSKALATGLAKGWLSVEWLLSEVRPAAMAVEQLPQASQSDQGVRKAVGELIAPLGDDPTAWLALYRRAGRFPASPAALVAAARADADRGAAVSWPRPLEATFPSHEPEGARKLFQILFGYAEPYVQEAVVPYLDARAAQHLLVFGCLSRRVRRRIADVHGRAARIAHASRWDLPADHVEELLDLDDPEVNAKLYIYGAIAWEERVRILAGEGRRGGEVPVARTLLDDLLQVKSAHRRAWLTAGHFSGDPDVLRVTLSRCRLHTEGGRLRAVLRLWERHGPQTVEAFLDEQDFPGRSNPKHPLPAGTHKTVRQALAASDGPAALRERLAAEEAPDRLVALLRKAAAGSVADRVRHLVAEGAVLPWPELIRTHEQEPLSAHLLAALAADRDCPRRLLVEALRAYALQPRAEGMEWLTQALDDGRLTTADVFEHSHPAPVVLAFLTATDTNHFPAKPRWRQPFRAASALVHERLGEDPEAWATAVRLLPDFTGSLPELLTAATSAASRIRPAEDLTRSA